MLRRDSRAGDEFEIIYVTAPKIEVVQTLWGEYWRSIGLEDGFRGFAEERRTLPGVYAPPNGCLLLALVDSEPAGTAALRALGAGACEAKRLFVRPEFRGVGLGKALLARLIAEARDVGYREMYADTLPSLNSALEMYDRFGFIRVGPYSEHPTPGAVFLKLTL